MVTVQEINLSEFFCMCGNRVLIQLFIVYAFYKMAFKIRALGVRIGAVFNYHQRLFKLTTI